MTPLRGYLRGNVVQWDAELQGWRYYPDGAVADPDHADRTCGFCGQAPTVEGMDACFGEQGIPGATSACCGHGVHPGYVGWPGIGAPPEWWRRVYVGRKAVEELTAAAEPLPPPDGPVPLLPLQFVSINDPSFSRFH